MKKQLLTANKNNLNRRSIAEILLEFWSNDQVAVAAVNAENAEIVLCKTAHFLNADVEIRARFLDREKIFLTDWQNAIFVPG